MPVTARLSQKFYEQLGEDIANELVDWFNAVDATYQTQLRELNELNYQRFRADLRAEIASVRSDIAGARADLIKWMFTFGTAMVVSLGGLMVALLTAFK